MAAAGAAQPQPPIFDTIYDFQGSPDASTPVADLILGSDGALYGSTIFGGNGQCTGALNGCGTVFRLAPPDWPGGAWKESVLYSFQGGSDGWGPNATLVSGAGGVLYGTTVIGGSKDCFLGEGCGVVFELRPPGTARGAWTETVIYRFKGGSDGAEPMHLVGGKHGVLYGMTYYGGTGICSTTVDGGCGTVFALTPPASPLNGWTKAVLYNFTGGRSGYGFDPSSLTIGKNGALYGTTFIGGDLNCPEGEGLGCGVVFGLVPPLRAGQGWKPLVLHRFSGGCCDGAGPNRLTFGMDGTVYVSTFGGGSAPCTTYLPAGCGTVVRLTQAAPYGAWTATLLYVFQALGDGGNPNGVVIGRDGALYGTAQSGGSGCGRPGCGTVFKLEPEAGTPSGMWMETTIHSFTGGAYGSIPNGSPAISERGVLFGTTNYGGACLPSGGCGTVFRLVP
jgi:uncharacterized repeat protein (TIGR03803 family)